MGTAAAMTSITEGPILNPRDKARAAKAWATTLARRGARDRRQAPGGDPRGPVPGWLRFPRGAS